MKPIKRNRPMEWSEYKSVLKEGLTPVQAANLDVVLDNTRKEYIAMQRKMAGILVESASASAVSTGNIATLNKVVLPIIRRVLPDVIANEIVGVQPMSGPVGQITTLRNTYGNTVSSAGVIAGEEAMTPIHIRDLAVAYSGNQIQAVPAGALSTQLEGVPGNTLKVEFLKQTVEAKTRRLAARWTIEAQTDAQNQYGTSIEDTLLANVAKHITSDIDQEILRALRRLPPVPTAANTFDQSAVSGQPITVVDEFASLAVLMNRQANLVAQRIRHGKANWAVLSTTALTVLESAKASQFARTTEGKFDAPVNSKYVGMLNNQMKIFVDTYGEDQTPVLVGYKGDEVTAATYYCPYVPLTTHGVITDPNTFESVTSFFTRYGYIEFVNTATSLGNSADYLGLVGVNASALSFL